MTATPEALKTTQLAAQAAADKFARDIVAFDVSDQLSITDVFLVATASTDRQVGAVVDGIEETLHKAGLKPKRREGERENRWVLLDYIDVVVHVQQGEERELYSLERLWKDCPRIELDLDLKDDPDEDGFTAAAAQQSRVVPSNGQEDSMDDDDQAEQVWDDEGGLDDPEVDTDTPVPHELSHQDEVDLEDEEMAWDDEGGLVDPEVDTDTPVDPTLDRLNPQH